MIYHGHIENGHVVLDEPATLPEGIAVTILLRPEAEATRTLPPAEARAKLMKFAGIATDLPEDAARNLDHYLYGYSKR